MKDGWRRQIGRGGPFLGGSQGAWERIEPPPPSLEVEALGNPGFKVKLTEGLYVHYFKEKSQARESMSCPLTLRPF